MKVGTKERRRQMTQEISRKEKTSEKDQQKKKD